MSELSITIKYGKGYDESWANFRGENCLVVRDQLVDYFGLSDEAGVRSLTLDELVQNCTKQAHGVRQAITALGGTVIPAGDSKPADEAQAGDPWAEAEQPEDPLKELFLAVERQTSVEDLKKLWAENQKAFEDPKLLDAYRAKGKALKAAG